MTQIEKNNNASRPCTMAVSTLVATTLHCPAKHETLKVTNAGTSPFISLFSLQLGQHNCPVVPRCHPKSRTCFSQSLAPAPRCSSHRTGTHGARPWAGAANSSEIKTVIQKSHNFSWINVTLSRLLSPCQCTAAHILALAQWRRQRWRNVNKLPGEGGTVSLGNNAN